MTVQNGSCKPDKPYSDFPLFAHANGLWAKTIRVRLYSFGPWASPDEALGLFLHQWYELLAGRPPKPLDDERANLRSIVIRSS